MTLLEAISARHSVRKYIDKDIPADIIAALQEKVAECNKEGNLNIQLVQNETRAFTGMLSYGQFSGVKNYLVMVGKKSKDLDERVGYYGEQLVRYAHCKSNRGHLSTDIQSGCIGNGRRSSESVYVQSTPDRRDK